jgi:hypothetical protein
MVGLTLSAAARKSPAFDELIYLTGGYSYWTLNDYRLNPDNGNLTQRLEALPLLASRVSFPSLDQDAWRQSHLWKIARQFFYECGNDADSLVMKGRFVVAMVSAGLGVLVYSWSRVLFGRAGALVSASLYAFCPSILANSGLATSDLIASFFFLAALWTGWAAWHLLSPGRLLLSGLALAGLFLAKMSAFCILPVAALLFALRIARGTPLRLAWPGCGTTICRRLHVAGVLLLTACVQVAITVFLIWAAYDFRFAAFQSSTPGRDSLPPPTTEVEPGMVTDGVQFLRRRRLLPEAFLHGVTCTLAATQERPAFFNGEYGTKGWLLFFPYCLLVKTPLAVFGLLGLAAAGVFVPRPGGGGQRRALLYETAPLTVFLAVYWGFALRSHLNIGHRHLLPTYPPMFILCGAVATWLERPDKWPRFLTATFLAVFVVESVATWPNYLSYFNMLAGGSRSAYRHLVDSSLDWGQDLPALKRWLRERGLESEEDVYLSYFGSALPQSYGIRATPLPSFLEFAPRAPGPLRGGVYCISATMLQGIAGNYICPGPWTGAYEARYRSALALLGRIGSPSVDPAAREALLRQAGFGGPAELAGAFEQLRFGRLCAFLRQREPDEEVGYSILIYRLSDDDLRQALSPATPLGDLRRK